MRIWGFCSYCSNKSEWVHSTVVCNWKGPVSNKWEVKNSSLSDYFLISTAITLHPLEIQSLFIAAKNMIAIGALSSSLLLTYESMLNIPLCLSQIKKSVFCGLEHSGHLKYILDLIIVPRYWQKSSMAFNEPIIMNKLIE